jgi:MFS family permease
MLSPILGGLVVATLGYRTLFAIGGLAAVGNIVASARLKEPRRRLVAAGEEAVPV